MESGSNPQKTPIYLSPWRHRHEITCHPSKKGSVLKQTTRVYLLLAELKTKAPQQRKKALLISIYSSHRHRHKHIERMSKGDLDRRRRSCLHYKGGLSGWSNWTLGWSPQNLSRSLHRWGQRRRRYQSLCRHSWRLLREKQKERGGLMCCFRMNEWSKGLRSWGDIYWKREIWSNQGEPLLGSEGASESKLLVENEERWPNFVSFRWGMYPLLQRTVYTWHGESDNGYDFFFCLLLLLQKLNVHVVSFPHRKSMPKV